MIVSCVILNYNDSETVKKLLNEVETYSNINHVIVVDNYSTDDSYSILKEFESSKITVIKTSRNGGYGYGNNVGIRYSSEQFNSDYTIIANPDVSFKEQCVVSLVKFLREHPECGIVSAREITDPNSINAPNQDNRVKYVRRITNGMQDVLSSSLIFNRINNSRYYNSNYFVEKEYCYVDIAPGAMLVVDTRVMMEYGMYDEEFFLFEEEKILAYKMKQAGYKTALLLTEEFLHSHSVSISKTYTSAIAKKKILLNSKKLFLKKYKKFNSVQMLLSKIVFTYSIFEMYIYSKIRQSLN